MTASPAAKLAILGGKPAFAEPLHVGRPNLPDKSAILERIAGVLDRNWLTNGGPLVTEFEQRIAAEVGVRHCIATANGTVALELAAAALGLAGEVIVPGVHVHRDGARAGVAGNHSRFLRRRPGHSHDRCPGCRSS